MCYYTVKDLACVSCLTFFRSGPSYCLSESLSLCDLFNCNHTLESLITVKADAMVKFPLIFTLWDLLKWCNVLIWSALPQSVCESAPLDLHEFILKKGFKNIPCSGNGGKTLQITIVILFRVYDISVFVLIFFSLRVFNSWE